MDRHYDRFHLKLRSSRLEYPSGSVYSSRAYVRTAPAPTPTVRPSLPYFPEDSVCSPRREGEGRRKNKYKYYINRVGANICCVFSMKETNVALGKLAFRNNFFSSLLPTTQKRNPTYSLDKREYVAYLRVRIYDHRKAR